MHKIRLLSDLLVNQIAAGEVVQRPASVVKELLENAIDAESKTITVIIKEAGKQLIQVVDDGIGMDATDARICFEKHATSKITTLDDLYNIQTMGFRGEAMASIAAVAQVTMETRLHEAAVGTTIVAEGSTIKKQEAVATPPGTKISVKNLFFNTPARRNFLKSNLVEFKHILEEVQHAALARPTIAFHLYHNGTEIYKLPSTKLSHRIIHLLGEGYQKQLIPCKEETDRVTIKGYIGKPEQAKKTRGDQFIFVNQRFIKSPFLNHALKGAYDRLIPGDMFPFYLLNITIPPQWIDVNVHPSKTEIKFQDEKTIYALLQAVVKRSLATYAISDSIDFEQDINFLPLTNPTQVQHFLEKPTKYTLSTRTDPSTLSITPPENGVDTAYMPIIASEPKELTEIQSYNSSSSVQLYGSYIVTQIQSGALLVDQQAAHERILYDKFINHYTHKSGASQQLLIPEYLTLTPIDYHILLEYEATLRALGFVIDPFGSCTVIIHGCPAELSHLAPKPLLISFLEQTKLHNSQNQLNIPEHGIRTLAKKASIPHGTKLHSIEMDALLAQLFASSNTMYTPDGKKICSILPQATLVTLLI